MKREQALVNARREEILAILKKTGRMSVEELSVCLQVPPLTVRRDLKQLGSAVVRYYGGAALPQGDLPRQDLRLLSRELIARRAAALVENGDNIFINSSMTALTLVKYLTGKRVVVITNNGRIMNMDVPQDISVVLTGGEVRYPKHVMVGEYCIRNLENITVDKSFLGCSGLSFEKGMTTGIMNEVLLNSIMLAQTTGQAYILADYTKVGVNSNYISQDAHGIRHIITDDHANEAVLRQFEENGAQVTRVMLAEYSA